MNEREKKLTGVVGGLILEGEHVGIDPDHLMKRMLEELRDWQLEMKRAAEELVSSGKEE